jgi:hypothetical protein
MFPVCLMVHGYKIQILSMYQLPRELIHTGTVCIQEPGFLPTEMSYLNTIKLPRFPGQKLTAVPSYHMAQKLNALSERELRKTQGYSVQFAWLQSDFSSFPFSGCRSQEFNTSVSQLRKSYAYLPPCYLGTLLTENGQRRGAISSRSTIPSAPEGQRELLALRIPQLSFHSSPHLTHLAEYTATRHLWSAS